MSRQLNGFLKSVQRKAFAQAEYAVGNRDEALDIVQDSMMKLAKNYGGRSQEEWPLLFQRILQNQIRDWYRRQKVRRILFWWEQHQNEDDYIPELLASAVHSPTTLVESEQSAEYIDRQIQALPFRQQQVFMLRAFWGHSIDETAEILGCTAGTVKTHYSRALNALRDQLEVVTC